MAKCLCWMNEEARCKALVSVGEIICSHAVGIDSDNTASGADFRSTGNALQISGPH